MIKTLRDICIEQPEFDKVPMICVKIIRRVNDEEGIKVKIGAGLQILKENQDNQFIISRYENQLLSSNHEHSGFNC